jgi:Mor family transcriptional regulator
MNKTDREARDKLIVKGFKDNVQPQDLAKKHKISYQRVLQIISDNGLTVEPKTNKEEEDLIVSSCLDAVEKGKNLEKIFKKWGRSKVYYILGKRDIKPGKLVTDRRNASLAEDFRMGLPPKDIAEKYDVNQSYVYELLSKMGLKTFPTTEEIKKRNKEIRDLYATDQYTQDDLALKFNLSRGCIGLILTYAAPYND